jgi:hypothetical protein
VRNRSIACFLTELHHILYSSYVLFFCPFFFPSLLYADGDLSFVFLLRIRGKTWLEKAASKGHADALFLLSIHYRKVRYIYIYINFPFMFVPNVDRFVLLANQQLTFMMIFSSSYVHVRPSIYVRKRDLDLDFDEIPVNL